MIPAAGLGMFALGLGIDSLTERFGRDGRLFDLATDPERSFRQQNDTWRLPVSLPPLDGLLAARIKGYFEYNDDGTKWDKGWEIFANLCRMNGAAVGLKDSKPALSEVDLKEHLQGWHAIQRSMLTRPNIGNAFQALIAGAIDRKKFDYILKRNGALGDDWIWLLPLMSQRLTIDQIVEIYKRGTISKDEFNSYCKMIQYGVPKDVEYIEQLAKVIPNYQDIVRFAIREAFNPAQVKLLGLDQELNENPDYLDWCNAVGLGEVEITTPKGEKKRVNFAELYWYAHWDLPSPTMAYAFTHRYYADSRYGPSPWLRHATPFGKNELNALLKAADYSPQFRAHLAGISYLPLNRIDVRRLRISGIIKERDVYHNYRAQGYDDQEATWLTQWTETQVDPIKSGKYKNAIKGRSCKAYQLGVIDSQAFELSLTNAGFTKEEAGMENTLCQFDNGNKIASEGIKAVKVGFLSGAYTEPEARLLLKQLRVQDGPIMHYLFTWNMQLNSRRRVVAAKEVSQWFIDGIIDIIEFNSRLTKLQYGPSDITRIIQAAQLEQARRLMAARKKAADELARQTEKNIRDAEKARQRAEQLRKQQERELQRRIDELQRQERERLARFLSARTEANLKAWWAANEIGPEDIAATFRLKGWAEIDIRRWLRTYNPE